MIRRALALLACIAFLAATPAEAADPLRATTRAACGAESYAVGSSGLLVVTQTGLLCLNVAAGGSTSALQTTGNASLSSLDTKLGEVQANPTANTVLDRLKTIADVVGAGNIGTLNNGTAAAALRVTVASDSTGQTIALGNVADAATDSGNPVKIGAIYNTTKPTYTNGQRTTLQSGSRGALRVELCATDSNSCVGSATVGADGVSNSTTGINNWVFQNIFNGASWDRQFTCATTAAINVTAGNTTELVALTASQVIRVCSFSLAMSATGTAKFVYGTGTNCGTGTTDINTAMNLLTATPWSMSAGNASLFRTASANALCLAAATGNVTGFVSYAKY